MPFFFDPRFDTFSNGTKVFNRFRHKSAVTPFVMDGRTRAVDIRHRWTIDTPVQPAQGETYSVLVPGITHGDDAEPDEFLEARASGFQQGFGSLFEVISALMRIQFASFEKQMRMRFDKSRKQRVLRQLAIGMLLRRV